MAVACVSMGSGVHYRLMRQHWGLSPASAGLQGDKRRLIPAPYRGTGQAFTGITKALRWAAQGNECMPSTPACAGAGSDRGWRGRLLDRHSRESSPPRGGAKSIFAAHTLDSGLRRNDGTRRAIFMVMTAIGRLFLVARGLAPIAVALETLRTPLPLLILRI